MKNRTIRILGLLSFLAGILFFLDINITGFVVANDIQNLPSFIGLVLISLGIVLVSMARRFDYDAVAEKVYEHLFLRGGYGHHTERIVNIETRVARGDVSKQHVREVIGNEANAGRLSLTHGTSISLPVNRGKLYEIGELYGKQMRPVIRQRLEELKTKHRLKGVRS